MIKSLKEQTEKSKTSDGSNPWCHQSSYHSSICHRNQKQWIIQSRVWEGGFLMHTNTWDSPFFQSQCIWWLWCCLLKRVCACLSSDFHQSQYKKDESLTNAVRRVVGRRGSFEILLCDMSLLKRTKTNDSVIYCVTFENNKQVREFFQRVDVAWNPLYFIPRAISV